MINTKLPRCPHDGDRGRHDFEMRMVGGRVTFRCVECGGYLCKDEPAANVKVQGARFEQAVRVRMNADRTMVRAD